MKAGAAQRHACIYRQNPLLELRQDPFCEPCPEQGSLRRIAPLDAVSVLPPLTPVSNSPDAQAEIVPDCAGTYE